MKKCQLLLLIVIIILLHSSECTAMEESWEEVSVTEKAVDWQQIRQIISDTINTTYQTKLTALPFNTALSIITTPETTFPDIADNFNNVFFENLCNQNETFKKALTVIVDEIKKNISMNLTGLTIDALYSSHAPFMNTICKTLKKFLDDKLIEALKKKESYTLTAHTNSIKGVDIYVTMQRAATASEDKTAIIWNLNTGKPEHVLQHRHQVNSVSFSSDGSVLATAIKNSVYLWSTTTGIKLYALSHDSHPFNHAYFSPNNNILFAYYAKRKTCEMTTLLWKCKPNSKPKFISTLYLPLLKVTTFHDFSVSNCGIRVKSKEKDLRYEKTSHTPHLCSIAFHNSKQNKPALKALLNSTLLTALPDIDKIPLQQSINQALQQLSQQKKECYPDPQYGIPLKELTYMKK
jgi:hypothetical protein